MGRPRKNPAAAIPAWAQRLTQARERAGFTQEQMGQAVGKTQKAYSGWEIGRYQPNLADLTIIASRTNISLDWLLTGREPPNRNALRDFLAQAQKENRHFSSVLARSARLLEEEGINADADYLIDFTYHVLSAVDSSLDDASAKEAIARTLEAERAEFRKGMDELRKIRLQS